MTSFDFVIHGGIFIDMSVYRPINKYITETKNKKSVELKKMNI